MLLCLAIAGVAIIKVTWDNAPGGPFHPRQAWETWKNERAAQQPSAQRPSSPKKQLAPRRPQVTLSSTSGPVEINPLISLSGKTRKEIFEIRKLFVQESIFHIPGYTPSAEVYGQIEDRKPWIANIICNRQGEPVPTQGPSEESRFINNPIILVGFESGWLQLKPNSFHLMQKPYCTSPAANYMPKRIHYDADEKEITITYAKPQFFEPSWSGFFFFNGKNARDLGYDYAYLDLSRSRTQAKFAQPDNITNRVHKFQDFFHTGGRCRVPGGCNNGSPNQPELNFNENFQARQKQVFYFKLWRKRPASPEDPADIYEKMVFE